MSKLILLLLLLILIGCRNENFNSEENQSSEILNSKERKSINSDTIKMTVESPASLVEDDPKSPPRK